MPQLQEVPATKTPYRADLQEKGENILSATQEIANKYSIPVISIINLEDIIKYLETAKNFNKELELIKKYQNTYGII